jgi:glycosyltransferase involved in cell wall biosynthesis
MRILMLSHGYPPTISGVTLVVQKVARAMVVRGHQVTVVTASDRRVPYQDEDHGVRLWRVHSVPNPFWSEGPLPIISYNQFKGIVAEVQPDVINTHDGALLSWQLHRLEHEKTHVPEILTCHFLPHFVSYYVRAGDAVERLVEGITWDVTVNMIQGFDHVVFPSATQEAMFHKERLRVPSTVISNGLDISRYSPDGDDGDLQRKYQLPQGPRVLFVGRMAKDKKIDVLIKALRRVEKAHLLLVGRGDDQRRLESLVKDLSIAGRVHFLGFVLEGDLPGLYRASQLFAIASDVEVQSIPTLQAVACGKPIVAADAGALPELVKHGVNGYLVPPGDPDAFGFAMAKILDSPQLLASFGQASLPIGSRHSEEKTFDAYESLYQVVAQA